MKITVKCPKCRKLLKFEMFQVATDIRYHTCVNTGNRWVIKINPPKSIDFQSNPAQINVVDWQEVV